MWLFVWWERFHLFTFPHPGFNLSRPARRYHCFYAPPAAELPIWSGIVLNLWKDCQHSKLPVSELEMWRRPAKCSLHIFSLGHSSQMGDLHPTNLLDQPDKINTKTQSNQTHICYWRNMMINICKRKSFSWSFEIIKKQWIESCLAVHCSQHFYVLFLGCRVGLPVSPPLHFQLFQPSSIYLLRRERQMNKVFNIEVG